ncbi:MAG: imidazoleglycerol-phosphate dehydratase HisB [SAR202 cluster bacterium]|nr:imidazoleglycerol-phosphate dehydratase HisB [SAR202 cluster bacterium]|tara:strand:- start:402 stop:1007 length:606 start_codon:yes stop_codon:yes gene_type:complete
MSETKPRVATIVRETGESKISVTVNLDGTGKAEIDTPVGFLKHMLHQIARHGMIDLKVEADGDLETGSHHTVEDTAIVLGRTLDKALGDRKGIVRMADRTCPLDEALTQSVIDLSGRGYAVVNMGSENNIGEFPSDLARHFFEAMAIEGRFCLHIRVLSGQNEHHVIESAFKAFARALRDASRLDERNPDGIPSTKGTLTQ